MGLNDFRISYASDPAVAASNTNQFLVVWDGREAGGAFGNGETEIFGLSADAPLRLVTPPSLDTLSTAKANGVLSIYAVDSRNEVDRHAKALSDVLREWSVPSNADRVKRLRPGFGDGQLFAPRILDDNQVDLLIGSWGRDWFRPMR